ncbi:autophagy-related protein 13-domain-containing protein, partial [Sphaerosporella brunnea]
FNLELDEMETFRDELGPWRLGDSFDPRPSTLIIETYLDTNDLTPTQALVITDGNEKRWNVTETLEHALNRAGLNVGARRGERNAAAARAGQHIVLERWRIELSAPFDLAQTPELPVVYKKSIILFRALYSYLGMMPTWKFRRRLSKVKLHTSSLKIGCRILSGDDFVRSVRKWDGLNIPLFPGDERVAEDFSFGKVESPAGSFTITTSYRKNCDFRVDDSEALLSSHFINLDEHYFRPSSHQRTSSQPSNLAVARGIEQVTGSNLPRRPDYLHGLSSFPQTIGASPLSQLRATEMGRTGSGGSPIDRPPSSLRSVQGSRTSLRGGTDIRPVSRRGSMSFQPFKSPSLSASPATDQVSHGSVGRASTPGVPIHRPRPSVGAISPSSYKSAQSTVTPSEGTATHTAQTPIPISASPASQPMTRIASSFGSRRPRISSAASVTRADDDNSSGQASYTSSMAAPGSALYTAAGTSSYEDGVQIRDFMTMLADGQKNSLKSFGGGDEPNKLASNPLSKFQKMKDSQSALAESMSSSLLLQPSSSPSTSSRNLSSVPGMVHSTAFSQSSSPGNPLSPQTPHTPAVPSRLSAGLTAQYGQQESQRQNRVRSPPASNTRQHDRIVEGGAATTSPLDIPTSPRFIPRRAHSMSQQPHAAEEASQHEHEDDTLAFGPVRPPSMDTADEEQPRYVFRFPRGNGLSSSGSSYRAGRVSGRGRGDTPLQGSTSSLDKGPSSSIGSSARPAVVGRRTPSWSRAGGGPEDDDLLFAMSDMMIAQNSRRSLDQDKAAGGDSPTSSGRRRSRGNGVGDSGRGAW